MNDTVRQAITYAGIALIGAGAGLLVGVLIAPASGRETRRRLNRRLEDEREELLRRGRRAVEDVGDRIEQGKRRLGRAAHS